MADDCMPSVMDTFHPSWYNFAPICFFTKESTGWAEPDPIKINSLWDSPGDHISLTQAVTSELPYHRKIYELTQGFIRKQSPITVPLEISDLCFVYVGAPNDWNMISDFMPKQEIKRMKKKQWNLKCVLVGNGCVGKTSLFISYVGNYFPRDYCPRTAPNYTANIKRYGQPMTLSLWDTQGQEYHDRLRPLSYPGTDLFLVCFSTDHFGGSYANVETKWIPEIQHHAPDAAVLIVGTKTDVGHGDQGAVQGIAPGVSTENGLALAKKVGASSYVECSALTADGVRDVFEEAVRFALKLVPSHSQSYNQKRRCMIM